MRSVPPYIHEAFTCDAVPAADMDRLWAAGWRHFGPEFFRYSLSLDEAGQLQIIQPLRLPPRAFRPSKSQRRVWRKNADADIRVVPAVVDDEREALFLRHRERFRHNIPDSLRTFLASPDPAHTPCRCMCVEVRTSGRLIAVSYLDVGAAAVSSVYALFAPEESARSPGVLTLLAEIEWAAAQGMQWLYPGYATVEPSHYDYKKSFRPLETYDWRGQWHPLEAATNPGGAAATPPRPSSPK